MKNKEIKKLILGLQKSISEIEKDIEIKTELVLRYKATIEYYESKIYLDYKVGAVLIAINECKMQDDFENALIIGKEYEVLSVINNKDGMHVIVKSERHFHHFFPFSEVLNYFKIK